MALRPAYISPGSFGEYGTTFDASGSAFPTTARKGDWFNCTVEGTVDSQAFLIGDIIIALVDNPSTTTFAANWTIVPSPLSATKIAFYTTTPIVKQTGVAVTEAGIHAALVNLGLFSA